MCLKICYNSVKWIKDYNMSKKGEATFIKRLIDNISVFFRSLGTKTTKIFVRLGRFVKRVAVSVAGAVRKAALWAVSPLRKNKSFVLDEEGTEAATEKTQIFDSADLTEAIESKQSKRTKAPEKTRVLPHIMKEHLTGEGKEHINMFTHHKRNPSFVIGVALTSFKLLLIALFMIASAGVGTLVGVAKAYMETTPTLDTGKIQNQKETSYIYDANDDLITVYTGVENRDWASFEEIPDMLKKAVVAIEDVRFYRHTGVDIKRLLGAFLNNLMNSNVQGGSTLTQQLIKNRLLTFEKSYKRKIQEAYLALQLEQEYTKDQILEAYMNTMHLGASNYGVKAAAMDYFGKSLDKLTLRECAMLAGITQYPYMYNPRRQYYDMENPDKLIERTNKVLWQMYKADFITEQDYNEALNDDVYVVRESKVHEMYEMPYFVEYAVYDVITHLLKQRNMQDTKQNRTLIDNEIRTNGYEIYTTVDPKIQNTVQQSLEEWDEYPALADPNKAVDYGSDDTKIIQPQAAVVVVDQHTGELKAVVGGRETPTFKKTLNRAYQTKMPVGSSIKPISVYAPAIDKGYSDGTIVPNLPLPINGWDSEKGFPKGGERKYGPVSLRTGIVSSLNSATAYTLLELVGIQTSKNYLINMGVNPAHIQPTGAGLALGTSGITPIEMAGAYATIANEGEYLEPLSFRYVKDKDNNIILSADDIREKRQVLKPTTAWLITDMLVNAVEKGTGQDAQIEGMTIGGKTGTNQEAKGVFFAGISPYYTTTLWIGHDGFESLHKDVFASNSAAPLWQYIMDQVLADLPNKPIIDETADSLGLIRKKICSVSGQLATSACELDVGGHRPIQAYFVPGTEPTQSCQIHQKLPVCLTSNKIATTHCPTGDELIEVQGLLFLDRDSIYWRLTDVQRNDYLPGAFPALTSGSVYDLTPDMPAYFDYFCAVHTQEWANEQANKAAAIEAANAQIAASRDVLADPTLSMSAEHRQELADMIAALTGLIADPETTSAAIEQKTAELKTLTNRLVALYSPPEPTPTEIPTPTETPTPEL